VNAFVPGVEDILSGNYKPEFQNIPPAETEKALPVSEKIERGKLAISAFGDYKNAMKARDAVAATKADSTMKANFPYFGYGYLHSPEEAVPNVALTFYSFRSMVIFGFYFILLFIVVLYLYSQNKLVEKRWLQYVMLWTIPIVYLAALGYSGSTSYKSSRINDRDHISTDHVLDVRSDIHSLTHC
jgi:cytochrome bd ubiquinol oxidase subunit I